MQKKVPILIQASISHYVAMRDRSLSDLQIYLTNQAGVDEQAKITDRVIKLFKDIDHANGILNTINDVVESSIGFQEEKPNDLKTIL